MLLHPEQISAKFDSWLLALLAALTFAVATLGINVVANFVSPAFDFANVFPQRISFKKGGYIAAGIALVLYPFAPWEGNAAALRQRDRRDDGAAARHHPGRLLPDRQGQHQRRGALPGERRVPLRGRLERQCARSPPAIGAVFSSILPNFTNLLPSWWGTYGWFFGVAIGGVVYYVLAMVRPRGMPAAKARA